MSVQEPLPMKYKDKNIYDIIEKLKEQYHVFISNQFINYYLLESNIPKNDWIDIEDLINSNKFFEEEGYDLDQLYGQILSFTNFLKKIKEEILPRILRESPSRMNKMSNDNRILYKMTVNNTSGNLKIFYAIISELFHSVKKLDSTINGEGNMLYSKLPHFKSIERNLAH
jgi:hypothetical protein